jgi:hypothetical protein
MHARAWRSATLMKGLSWKSSRLARPIIKDDLHLWIYKHIPQRDDNLLCVAAVDAQAIIVKTVMTDWKIKELPK